jgi:hypothetical protein
MARARVRNQFPKVCALRIMDQTSAVGFFLFVFLLLLCLQATPGRAQSSTTPSELSEADRVAIRAVIEDQLAAFQRDDGPAAFAHASPAIRIMFGTPENFMRMVRQGYQPVYRPRRVEFLDILTVQGDLIQKVRVVGPDGIEAIALYQMQRQPKGGWKINGCVLTRPEGKRI